MHQAHRHAIMSRSPGRTKVLTPVRSSSGQTSIDAASFGVIGLVHLCCEGKVMSISSRVRMADTIEDYYDFFCLTG